MFDFPWAQTIATTMEPWKRLFDRSMSDAQMLCSFMFVFFILIMEKLFAMALSA